MTLYALRDLTEKEWQAQVLQLASTLGWRPYHTFDSRRSAGGFPDLVLVRERVVYLELKREGGRLSSAQKTWLLALDRAGGETYLARPADFDVLARLLGHRGLPYDARGDIRDVAAELRACTIREVST